MDRNRYQAIVLRMMAEGEIRLARHSKALMVKQAKYAADAYKNGETISSIPNGVSDWNRLLITHYAVTTKTFGNFTSEQLGGTKASFETLANGFIARSALYRSSIINQTTLEAIADAIRKGQEEGLGQNEIAKLIRDSVGGAIANYRARTIARTEIHNAATYASQLAAEQSERPLIREWVSAEDSRARPAHAEANGQQRELFTPFEIDGELIQRPGEGSPENAINCRCTLMYIPKSIAEL